MKQEQHGCRLRLLGTAMDTDMSRILSRCVAIPAKALRKAYRTLGRLHYISIHGNTTIKCGTSRARRLLSPLRANCCLLLIIWPEGGVMLGASGVPVSHLHCASRAPSSAPPTTIKPCFRGTPSFFSPLTYFHTDRPSSTYHNWYGALCIAAVLFTDFDTATHRQHGQLELRQRPDRERQSSIIICHEQVLTISTDSQGHLRLPQYQE